MTTTEEAIDLVNAAIEAELAEAKELVVSEAAARIVSNLKRTDREALELYAYRVAETHISEVISRKVQAAKSEAASFIREGPRRRFAEALSAAEAGDKKPLEEWGEDLLQQWYITNDNNVRLRLVDMHAADLTYAANRHDMLAQANMAQASFLRVLANKTSARKTVGQVFSPEQVARIWNEVAPVSVAP
jgi:hypothetical protein